MVAKNSADLRMIISVNVIDGPPTWCASNWIKRDHRLPATPTARNVPYRSRNVFGLAEKSHKSYWKAVTNRSQPGSLHRAPHRAGVGSGALPPRAGCGGSSLVLSGGFGCVFGRVCFQMIDPKSRSDWQRLQTQYTSIPRLLRLRRRPAANSHISSEPGSIAGRSWRRLFKPAVTKAESCSGNTTVDQSLDHLARGDAVNVRDAAALDARIVEELMQAILFRDQSRCQFVPATGDYARSRSSFGGMKLPRSEPKRAS
jgi:hypothetical protein